MSNGRTVELNISEYFLTEIPAAKACAIDGFVPEVF